MKEKQLLRLAILFVLGYLIYTYVFDAGRNLAEPMLGPANPEQVSPTVLNRAPELDAVDFDGAAVTLETLRGKAVLLTFWAPWCGACQHELKGLEALARQLGDEAHVLALATHYRRAENVVETAQDKSLKAARVLLDRDDDTGIRYGIRVFPTSLIIDPTGIVRYRLEGLRSWDSDSALRELRQIAACTENGCPDYVPPEAS